MFDTWTQKYDLAKGQTSLAGVDTSTLQPEELAAFRTLPAMIYYGCGTVEGVLMRSLSVPRPVCVQMGESFKSATLLVSPDITRLEKARRWLGDSDICIWEDAAVSRKLSGKDCRNLWLILSCRDPAFEQESGS